MEGDLRLTVGVCESPAELAAGSDAWRELCRTVSRESPDLFLLNEMPFGPWISAGETFDAETWRRSLALHEEGLGRLHELGARVVAGTRPREIEGRRVNEGFLWTQAGGLQSVHTKQYFPDEAGYFEARWFRAGPRHFQLAEAASLQVGFLICTELMFNEHARDYGRRGAHVILVPRAVGKLSLPRWLVAARMAAVVSGSYVLSSNRAGTGARGQEFGGAGWIIDPHGDVVGETSPANPAAFHEIDVGLVHQAQSEYPCYVEGPEVPDAAVS